MLLLPWFVLLLLLPRGAQPEVFSSLALFKLLLAAEEELQPVMEEFVRLEEEKVEEDWRLVHTQ